jgi:hypothetical protein
MTANNFVSRMDVTIKPSIPADEVCDIQATVGSRDRPTMKIPLVLLLNVRSQVAGEPSANCFNPYQSTCFSRYNASV